MDSLKFLLYTLARVGLMILLAVFSAAVGMWVFPSIANFIPQSMEGLNDFFTSDTVKSVVAWLLMLVFLVRIFYEDGKKHTAYELWSSVNVTITLIGMFLVGFCPAIFRDSAGLGKQGEFFYDVFYYSCLWLNKGYKLVFTTSVAVGLGSMLFLSLISYLAAYRIYVKKHQIRLSQKITDDTE